MNSCIGRKTDLEVLNLLHDDLDFMSGDDIALISPGKNRNRRFIKRTPA